MSILTYCQVTSSSNPDLGMELGLTLREFCKKNGFDPGNISKIERDLMAPPAVEELKVRYALVLGLKNGTDDWPTLFDLAAAGLGQTPEDLKQNEDLLKKPPLLLPTSLRSSC